jgi:cytochrome c oxidase subunit II
MVVLMRPSSRKWLAIAIAAAIVCGAGRAAQSQGRRVIRITAERFSFTPSEIVVEAGEDVELRLASDDTAHGFRISGTSVRVVIPKRGRGEIVVPFQAPKPGRYEFECIRMCGAGHDFMRGVLLVRERTGRASSR